MKNDLSDCRNMHGTILKNVINKIMFNPENINFIHYWIIKNSAYS